MPNSDSNSPDSEITRARLNGWKDIATYFGKGVRTVQRWEKEAGLPVRRVRTGRGEVVFAFVDELLEWGRTAGALRETGRDDDSPPADGEDQTPGEGNRAGADGGDDAQRTEVRARRRWTSRLLPVSSARRWIGVAILVVAAAVVSLLLVFRPGVPGAADQPSDLKFDAHSLRVLAADGRVLWTKKFLFALIPSGYERPGTYGRGPAMIGDIDGDGQQEVLLITIAGRSADNRLFCFNSDGSLRFDHTVRRSVQFGDEWYAGPWRADAFRVLTGADGRKTIWLASNHQDYFPTVIEKLDVHGNMLHEYWNDGILTVFEPATIAGRRVVLAGGVSNEADGAALVVLDAENPDGTAPNVRPYYGCRAGCRAGSAVEYLVFPETEIERLNKSMYRIADIRVDDRGGLTVVARHGGEPLLHEPEFGDVYYMFDSRLQPLHAQIESSFIALHNALFARKFLSRPYGPDDEAELWPLKRWNENEKSFTPIRPATPHP